MRARSNAFLSQVEVVQPNRWDGNPLEIVFIRDPAPASASDKSVQVQLAVHEWNQSNAAGYVRQGTTVEAIATEIPGIGNRKNPNIILAPRAANGISERCAAVINGLVLQSSAAAVDE